mgnify:CR=1 FL=1
MEKLNKCNHIDCNKKLTLSDLSCRCEKRFCIIHRLPESHHCAYDFKTNGRQQLKDNNPGCIHQKIIKI